MREAARSSSHSSSQDENHVVFNETPLDAHFTIGDELGSGQFAVVRRVTKKATGEEFAAKFIKKRRYATSRRGVTRSNIEREVSVLQSIAGHSNIIELHDVYETPGEIVLILELVSGGELFDHVCAKECLDEAEAAAFIKQILLGIAHLHSMHIAHLDIKPENVMLKQRGDSQVKLIDFGLSRRIPPGAVVRDMVGTPEFVAPEVVNYEALCLATDMWAMGVVTYILLSGGSPFLGDTRDETFCNITGVNYTFHDRYFKNTSNFAKDFISRLFVRDVKKRATVEECLQHPWIRGPEGDDVDIRKSSSIAISHIQSFKTRQRWRRSVEVVMICNRITRSVRLAMRQARQLGRTVDTRYDAEDLLTSALLIGCEEGNLKALTQLAAHQKLYLNARNHKGESGIHVASGSGHVDVLNYLHMKGADLSLVDVNGDTAMHWAARGGHANIVSYLAIEQLNVNEQNKKEQTPLHVAVRFGHLDVTHVLLEKAARVDILDNKGNSVLHECATTGQSMMLATLCSFGPSLSVRNKESETALHLASREGHMDCVQSLLDSGAPVDGIDSHNRTSLHCALERANLDVALLLIAKGCKVNEQDSEGNTPLHIACKIGLLSAVQTLCHCGGEVDIVNKSSMTALHVAAKGGYIEIVRVLCLARSNVGKKTKDGLTAEILALAEEHTQVAHLLSRMKVDNDRERFIDQLYPMDQPLRRIKLKMLGHSLSGKSRLVQALHSTRGITGSIIDAVSRRISDHYSPSNSMNKDDGIHSGQGSSFSSELNLAAGDQFNNLAQKPLHPAYTRGIDVQNLPCAGCGEFSVWEFGGYEPYHMAYDHFVGNTDCIHLIMYRASDPTEVQYKQVLYWLNFLKGRVTPSEPIGHCGIISRRSKVVIVGSNASANLFPNKNSDGEFMSSDADAMLKTVRYRFETHFDIHDKLILLDSTNPACAGMRALRTYLNKMRTSILTRLPKPLGLLDAAVNHLATLRKQFSNFPVMSWPQFSQMLKNDVNPLTGNAHCQQLIQQLQLIGEVVYIRDEPNNLDYVVLNAEWLGTHIVGQLLSAEFLSRCRANGIYTLQQISPIFPEIAESSDLLRILDTLQLCVALEADSADSFEFPAFLQTRPPKDVWLKDKANFVYGGARVHPTRGMERSLQSTFPRIQIALRRSMHDFQDPMDADLIQWEGCSKLASGQMEALVRLHGDAVEVCVRGPKERATSCFYFMEDVINMVEQTACEVAPGISLERHFLSPNDLREHSLEPLSFPPEAVMTMQQCEAMTIKGTDGREELFTDVVCFGSRDVARILTLGIDVSVSDLQIASRCELAALLDPPDNMGRDWSILAVKLNLTEQVPEFDSTGQSLSRTDQLLTEWSIQNPEEATVGRLCEILVELGRVEVRDALYRTVPLYLFAPIEEHALVDGDSGVVSSSHSSSEPQTNLFSR